MKALFIIIFIIINTFHYINTIDKNELLTITQKLQTIFTKTYYLNESISLDSSFDMDFTNIKLQMLLSSEPLIDYEYNIITFPQITFNILFNLNISQPFTGYQALPQNFAPPLTIPIYNNFAYINYNNCTFTRRLDGSFKHSKQLAETNTTYFKFTDIEQFEMFRYMTTSTESYERLTHFIDNIIEKHMIHVLERYPKSNTLIIMENIIKYIENNRFTLNDCINIAEHERMNFVEIWNIQYTNITRTRDESSILQFNNFSMNIRYIKQNKQYIETKVLYENVKLEHDSKKFNFDTIREGVFYETETTCIFNNALLKHI